MKKIVAEWEKRNLGVSCEELLVAKEDTVTDVLKACDGLTSEYQILKIPTGRTDLLFELQKLGFFFIESNVHLTKKISRDILPKPFDMFQKKIDYRLVSGDDQEDLLQKIRDNNIFNTDKVALDPYFSPKHSANRYYHWAKDILGKSGQAFMVSVKNQDVGFFVLRRHSDAIYESFLAGIFPEYKDSNMGFAVLSSPVIEAANQGGQLMETGTSSNNIVSLRLHLALGYEIQSIQYILVKHLS